MPEVTAAVAAAWSSTVSVAEVVCERFVELESLAVRAMVLLPRLVDVTATVHDWLPLGARVPAAGANVPTVPLPLWKAAVIV